MSSHFCHPGSGGVFRSATVVLPEPAALCRERNASRLERAVCTIENPSNSCIYIAGVQRRAEQPRWNRGASHGCGWTAFPMESQARSNRRGFMQLKRIAYTLYLSAGTALLAGVVAVTQAPGSPQQQPMPSQQPTPPGNQGTGAAGMGPGAYPGTVPTSQDFGERALVSKALEGGDAEVQLG